MERAQALGFGAIGFAGAEDSPESLQRLRAWLDAGYHGDMLWMAEAAEARALPKQLWPEVRSIILLGTNYGITGDALAGLADRRRASLALYARRRDYHEVIKGRLKELAGFLAVRGGADVKVFVDTAPVLERALAQRAGLGWQGKNTMLVSRDFGSWLFLGAIYTTLDLSPDAPGTDSCGTCTRCLAACPTAAFPQPYVLDATRCISYLTIEHKGPIPAALRPLIGNRVFGCDDCLAVCPWNKFASDARDVRMALRPELAALPLAELAALDDATFRTMFAGTPIKRTGRDRFVRNVLIAIGNSGASELAACAEARLDDASPLVRGAAVWALGRLAPPERFAALRARFASSEMDRDVHSEWHGDVACG